ncbi:MAG: DUF5666 domain-containing protein [Chloroflexota bacterium]
MNGKTLTICRGIALRTMMGLMLAATPVMAMSVEGVHAAPNAQSATTPESLDWTGFVEALPATGAEGSWTIGGRTFTVDGNTIIDQTNHALVVGACAEVDYEATGTSDLAIELAGVDMAECTEDEGATEDEDGDTEDEDGDTEDEDGDTEDEDGDTEDEDGDTEDEDETEVYGTVGAMPVGSMVGTWIVDGVAYVATDATEFEEEHGTFAVGSTVELSFTVVNGVNQLDEIETHLEPGTGPTTRTGVIQSLDASGNPMVQAADAQTGSVVAASIQAASFWQIGDATYKVIPFTALNEDSGSLVVGATAEVNSYTAADGTEIASQIRTISQDGVVTTFIFLPTMLQ